LTQRAVIDSWRANGGAVFEKDFTLAEAYSADEAFVTGTLGGVTPVVRIDGRMIGAGKPGPVTAEVSDVYREWILH
jgi:branched-chain amino acid aminotransferase